MRKAMVFIDGNNFYHGAKSLIENPNDIDFVALANLIGKEKKFSPTEIRWYNSLPRLEDDVHAYRKRMQYIESLRAQGILVNTRYLLRCSNQENIDKKVKMLDSWRLCRKCSHIVEADFLNEPPYLNKEKGVDVQIATDMVRYALKSPINQVVLLSGDADFVPAFELIKEIKANHVICLSSSVEQGYSEELRQKFDYKLLTRLDLESCLLN